MRNFWDSQVSKSRSACVRDSRSTVFPLDGGIWIVANACKTFGEVSIHLDLTHAASFY
jgi:hypothetical protein